MSKNWSLPIETRARDVLLQLNRNRRLAQYIDTSLGIPQPFRGESKIKLVVLGQDPTVKDAAARKNIKMVLNLDKRGSVNAYLGIICRGLGIEKENIYATNLYKNFFIAPPTQIEAINIFQEFSPVWLPVLMDELAEFVNVPMITLGEPILAPLLSVGAIPKIRHYWGYVTEWKTQELLPFGFLRPDENKLGRTVFPFPHQPSLRKEFYRTKMENYLAYVKAQAFQ